MSMPHWGTSARTTKPQRCAENSELTLRNMSLIKAYVLIFRASCHQNRISC